LRWSEVVLLALGVHKQHIKSFMLLIPVVDDPAATSLAFSFQSPSELTKATGTGDYNPLFRAKDESKLQSKVLFVLKQVANLSRKDWGFNKTYDPIYVSDVWLSRDYYGRVFGAKFVWVTGANGSAQRVLPAIRCGGF
jgi:hypothetical protein